MVDVTPLVKQGAKIVQGYTGDSFRISGEVYSSAVVIFEDKVVPWDAPQNAKELSEKQAEALLGYKNEADVFLLGTGDKLVFPDPAFKKLLKEKGIHLEIMDTGAACRTYNVLMAEGRRVAAALLQHS